jgi:hypothetical protein
LDDFLGKGIAPPGVVMCECSQGTLTINELRYPSLIFGGLQTIQKKEIYFTNPYAIFCT